MKQKKLLKLKPTLQHYQWGKIGKSSFIAPFVSNLDENLPYAELWIGTHPSGSATVEDSNKESLREIIQESPIFYLGEEVFNRYKELPFLLKILSINTPLSIQAHPDKKLASILHANNPEKYPDPNHKPEMGVALGDVTLLYGLKSKSEIRELLERFPPLGLILSKDLIEQLTDNVNHIIESDLRRNIYQSFVTSDLKKRAFVTEEIVKICSERISISADIPLFEKLIPSLCSTYGNHDLGIITGLLLNEVLLKPGEAIFIGPNIPHAYLSGDLIECMAASDNVIRSGLTNKFQDTETLLAMLDYSHSRGEVIRPIKEKVVLNVETTQDAGMHYNTVAKEFNLTIFTEISSNFITSPRAKPELLFVLGGEATIETFNDEQVESVELKSGEAILIAAATSEYKVTPKKSTIIKVS